jgi:hypothetical protein
MAAYQLSRIGVVREFDGASIPNDPKNRDWRKYQAWVVGGNTPDPMPVVVKPPPGDVIENGIVSDPILIAIVRRIAKKEGITERALLDEIRAEARSG